MNTDKHHIDLVLSDKFSFAELDADNIGWNDFEKYRRKKKRRLLFYLLLCGLVLIGFGLLMISNKIKAEQPNLQTQTNEKPTNISPVVKNSAENDINLNSNDNNPLANDVSKKEGKSSGPITRFENRQQNNTIGETQPVLPLYTFTEDHSTVLKKADLIKFGKMLNPDKETFVEPDEDLVVRRTQLSDRFFRLQAGMMLSVPAFKLSSNALDFIHKDYEKVRKNSEIGLLAYGFRLEYGKTLNRFELGMGLGYNQTEILGRYNFEYSEKPLMDIDGKIVAYDQNTPVTVNYTSKHRFTFIEIPMYADYLLNLKTKSGYYLHMAYTPQFLRSISGDLPNAVFMDQKEGLSTANFKTYCSTFELGLRYRVNIQYGLSFELMPAYRMNTGLRQSTSLYRNKFNDFGIQCSLKWNIKK